MRLIGAAATGLAAGCSEAARQNAPAERVLIDNVRGYTITSDGRLREFGSLLIGADARVEALDLAGAAGARRIDGRGRVCLTGMHDAHGHVWAFGAKATEVDLSGTRSLGEALRAVETYAREHPDRSWVLGQGWNEVAWGLGRLPTAVDIDPVTGDRPVWLERVDGHAGLANSAALRAAGIVASTPDPAGGRIVRDPDGRPSGVLVDAAVDLVGSKVPAPTRHDHEERLAAAQRILNQSGLTSVSDPHSDVDQLGALHDWARSGRLSMRINAFLGWDTFTDRGRDVRTDSVADDMLRVRTVKLYIDGALGSHGAAMLEPYTDQPDSRGLPQMSQQELTSRMRRVVDAGYQVAVHAIGDDGNRIVLNAYDEVLGATREPRLRHRIEHAQVVAPPDFPRFTQLGLIASMQPTHATDDMNMAETRVGATRIAGAYAWRTFLDQGTIIAAGSDFPYSAHKPFDGMHAAVTRTDRDGQPPGGWRHDQAMTVTEAFRAYTLHAAYAAHQEQVLGSLEPGKHADFILVDQNPFALEPGRALWETGVLQTWVGGRCVGEYGQL
ncbi:amidohydrolase [Nocardia sp. NPDC051052]|uniref:amidohydrolase n=1 Tax=Nocardia sp. NPDC051052 TaxID=3364322 RepID=UPI00379A860D